MRMVVFRSKNWNKIAEMPNTYKEFCFCAFMDDIFTFGGAKGGKRIAVDSCFQHSATSNRWKEAAELRAACAVFEENIVGRMQRQTLCNKNGVFVRCCSRRVSADAEHEKGDVPPRPGRCQEQAVCGGIRRGVRLGGVRQVRSFEVPASELLPQRFLIGTKIYIFQDSGSVVVYDIDNDSWSEVDKDTKSYREFICAKLPMYW